LTTNNDNNSFTINPSLKIDHVHLRVSDLKESAKFYQSILGFRVLKEDSATKTAFLTASPVDNPEEKEKVSPLLVLTQLDNEYSPYHKSIKKESGLYHFALLLPEREYLAAFIRHIKENLDSSYFEGMADHAVSESIYIHDPDHIGIEVYRDRSPSEWIWNNNKVHMVTEPLDVADLLTRHTAKTWDVMPPSTTIGHVHLHVSSLTRTRRFYNGVLGLYHTASYPGAYFFAADRYHHHVATNTWIGTNILPANNNEQRAPGLDHYAIALPNNDEEITRLRNNFANLGIGIDDKMAETDKQNHNTTFYVYDADGIKIQLLFR
jgi:catechol 2,3-dioxygenase